MKTSINTQQEKMRLKWVKEKQSWCVDNWRKMIFNDGTRIWIDQGNNAETFVWCHSNVTYEVIHDTSFKRPGKMAINILTIDAYVYIEILNNFLILSIENWFGDDEVIFQDNNSFCYRANRIKAFL